VQRSEKARKTVKVEIKSKDRIAVSMPQDVDVDVDAFLEKHKSLLEKKYKQFLAEKSVLQDDQMLYRGEYYKLVFRAVENKPEEEIVLGEGTITLFHEPHSNPYRILKRWMTRKTEELVNEVKEKHSEILGDPRVIRVAETARWGYTRKNGVIVVNWQLIALPPELSEYVIVHELVHLSALNHQKRFHYGLSKIFPDYKMREKILQSYNAVGPKFVHRWIP